MYNVEDAHREFLRIADVTDSISEYKTCLMEAFRLSLDGGCERVIKMNSVSNTSTNTLVFPFWDVIYILICNRGLCQILRSRGKDASI